MILFKIHLRKITAMTRSIRRWSLSHQQAMPPVSHKILSIWIFFNKTRSFASRFTQCLSSGKEASFLWPPALSPSPVWADKAASLLCCRMHNRLPREATCALGSQTAAITYQLESLQHYWTSRRSSEPAQEEHNSTRCNLTKSHKEICFCIHAWEGELS